MIRNKLFNCLFIYSFSAKPAGMLEHCQRHLWVSNFYFLSLEYRHSRLSVIQGNVTQDLPNW